MRLERALELASHVNHPVTAAVFAATLAAIALITLRKGKPWTAHILAVGIIILGCAPLVVSGYLQSRGVYRVRVIVLGPDKSPVEGDVSLSSSVGGEPKKVEGGWEFDIPPQTRPADGKAFLFASVNAAFLKGSSEVTLARDYYPTTILQLAADTSAVVRGVVMDARRKPVVGATVAIEGYPDMAVTDRMGNFYLPAHAADGQIVQLRAQKGQLSGRMSAPAGRFPIELIVK